MATQYYVYNVYMHTLHVASVHGYTVLRVHVYMHILHVASVHGYTVLCV